MNDVRTRIISLIIMSYYLVIIDDKDSRYSKIAIPFDHARPIMQIFRRIRHRYYRETTGIKTKWRGINIGNPLFA